MPRTFKALGVLLLYPSEDLRAALAEVEGVLDAEAVLTPATRAAVGGLVRELATADPLDLEEAYVSLFDRGSSLSLHLFQHAYGDARERGAAMVALRETYARHGLLSANGELPDYVPVLCEFLAEVPLDVGRPVLVDAAPVLRLLHRRLTERGSAYAAVFGALLELAGETVAVAPGPEPQPLDWEAELAALDAEWREEPVTFGADQSPTRRV